MIFQLLSNRLRLKYIAKIRVCYLSKLKITKWALRISPIPGLFLPWDFGSPPTDGWGLCILFHLGGFGTPVEVTTYYAVLRKLMQLLPDSLSMLALETQHPAVRKSKSYMEHPCIEMSPLTAPA